LQKELFAGGVRGVALVDLLSRVVAWLGTGARTIAGRCGVPRVAQGWREVASGAREYRVSPKEDES